jgi:hypothetical protein
VSPDERQTLWWASGKRPPRWTKDDSHLLVKCAAIFGCCGALLGFLSGDGLIRGALVLLCFPALGATVALLQIAYYWLGDWFRISNLR